MMMGSSVLSLNGIQSVVALINVVLGRYKKNPLSENSTKIQACKETLLMLLKRRTIDQEALIWKLRHQVLKRWHEEHDRGRWSCCPNYSQQLHGLSSLHQRGGVESILVLASLSLMLAMCPTTRFCSFCNENKK